ncbi:MAG: DegT/DnrJ/EryC1/StrS family aminotransferase [Flavobacteriales bacterium]|nr:DegT/DnrJ/EryC1/StrS family aminotransferase [Flavobacteriales bacterium]
MINVTKTFFPPLEEYNTYLEKVWKNEWLTNRGEMVINLEKKLQKKLKIDNILLTTNGTLPIQIALKLLVDEGEVITTPFSYVATTSSVIWQNCTPIFVDIHPEYLTIDETKIEKAITTKTKCILATHVFGNPCNVDEIEKIAKKHSLKVIYDAAHCFGVEYNNKSIFKYGDISTCSFHATKVFHTGEGGAIFCSDEELRHRVYYSHNFGHNGPLDFHGLGINAKISELQAAMGLSVLPHFDNIVQSRKKAVEFYDDNLNWNNLRKIRLRDNLKWNYSYYPIFFDSEEILLRVQSKLNQNNIYPRRYFYPSLNTLNYVKYQKCEVSEGLSKTVLCLPLYKGLENEDLKLIVDIINTSLC